LNYKLWKESLEAVREQIRQENLAFMSVARVAAVTATYAATKYSDLQESGLFDLIVFDEASQVGKAHALMVAGLGGRLLFAGDPKQLSPIVQSKEEEARNWLGKSPFDWKDLSGVGAVTLDEQSRMAEDICHTVSNTFYGGQLRVAADVDNHWRAVRTLSLHPSLGANSVSLFKLGNEARAVGIERRWKSPESAEMVVRLITSLKAYSDSGDVIVLTPYRAQRAEICQQLKAAGLDEKIVSTVHRAQGSERLVVIFDPVRPSSEFLNGPEGERLINVAISRAQARLIVLVHPDYSRDETVLARIVESRTLLDCE
jgi:DNA replication ATP-dependent helicase Dna2